MKDKSLLSGLLQMRLDPVMSDESEGEDELTKLDQLSFNSNFSGVWRLVV